MALTLVIRDGGGAFHGVFKEVLYQPFEAETGISVQGVPGTSEPIRAIEDMVAQGNPIWDMSLLSKAAERALAINGCLTELGPPKPNQMEIPDAMRDDFMAGFLIYANVLVYREGRGETANPSTWADFWNPRDFPGRRAMRRHAFDTLEQALLADGVDSRTLYPLDIDRAFRSLNAIRTHIHVWWRGGGECTELLSKGQVDIAAAWSGRVLAAIALGAPLVIIWEQGLWTYEGFAILGGTPHVELCRAFVEFSSEATRQAECASRLGYGPANPHAFEFIAPERATLLPTDASHFHKMIEIDTAFWGASEDSVTSRFETWMSG
jgi:putative spermidine/putrescine transport system substrate-binding protein